MTELRFSKYEGTGNDFVLMLDLDDERPLGEDQVRALCDRRLGVGADGAIRIVRSPDGYRMDYRNADGSLAEMCGNGVRCVGALLHDRGLVDGDEVEVATGAGVKHLVLHRDGGELAAITVGMGVPRFTKAAIPMRGPAWETFLGEPIELGAGATVKASAVSMGNPHLVLFLDEDPDRYHVGHIGPALERHELFPEGANVEFVRVEHDGIRGRVWERGSGETMACGSGACAVAVAANEAGLVGRETVVRFPGGELAVERRDDGEVLLTGPASHVFDGAVDVDRLLARRAGP